MEATEQTLSHVLNEMPDEFTSDVFCGVARRHGIGDKFIRFGNVSVFLHKHCYKNGSKRRWIKKEAAAKQVIHQSQIGYHVIEWIAPTEDEQIKAAIALLKSNGYKVMKPETEWKEV